MMNSSFSSQPSGITDMDTKSHTKTFNLGEECLEKGVGCTWGRGNKLTIYPRSQTAIQTPFTSENILLNIHRKISLFHPILRRLVNESNGTFLSVQKAAETAKSTDNQVEFLKLSRQYRSIIRVCIESLQEASEKSTDGLEKNKLNAYVTIFYSIECIWHLCEILHMDNVPGDIVLPFLLEWVRFHFPCHEQTAAQLLEACERGSEDHKDYWHTVIGMIVQGRVDVARALLKLHSDCDSNEFKLVDNSLKGMPMYSGLQVYGSMSTGEFTVSWKHWQAECRAKLNSRVFAAQPQLELIMKLIIGDYASFASIRPLYSSWFDLVGGWCMYTAPWSRRRELGALAAACAGMQAAPPAQIDTTVRALLDGDLHQVIHEIQQMSDCNWFATHLTDMLYHCGKLTVLDKHQENVTNRLRESLILEYGCLQMEHESLWPVGLSYLAACGIEGRRRAELMLERIPVRSDAKAMRVICEARKHGLNGVVLTVCRCLSTRHLTHDRVGPALAWALRGHCGDAAGRAATHALRTYTATRVLPAKDLLLTAPQAMLLHDALLFLVKYCDFHELYRNREFKKAGDLLMSLITSKIAPDYFWDTLLIDTLPLLERDEVVLGPEETCSLMQCLELRSQDLTADSAAMLRLALARNLARAALNNPMPQET